MHLICLFVVLGPEGGSGLSYTQHKPTGGGIPLVSGLQVCTKSTAARELLASAPLPVNGGGGQGRAVQTQWLGTFKVSVVDEDYVQATASPTGAVHRDRATSLKGCWEFPLASWKES